MNPRPAASSEHPPGPQAAPSWITLVLAVACGLIVANLYYAQPLAGPIGEELGLPPAAAGLIVTMIQIGYGLGLVLIVPLGDLIENRKLILYVMGLDILAVLALAFTAHPMPFLAAALLAGFCSVVAQIMVPYAVQLAPDAKAGQAAGTVMSGLLMGIMLARSFASFVTGLFSWHAVFLISALAMTGLTGVLAMTLPEYRPALRARYRELLASLGKLFLTTPVLRSRSLYQACLFAAFSLFWTASPLFLAGPFHLSQHGIGLFALTGVTGAIAAPIAGRVADRGWTRLPAGISIAVSAASFLVALIGDPGSRLALAALVLAAILLNIGVSVNLLIGQRVIFSLGAAYRSRLNGLYIAIFFIGGALGSALGTWTYAHGGWELSSAVGFALPAAAFLYYVTGH